MCVQRPVPITINENYETGEFTVDETIDIEQEYEKYKKRSTNVLLYQWGVWTTSAGARNLFELGNCVYGAKNGIWLYSDTDSCYGVNWNKTKLRQYNAKCKAKLKANGYGPVLHNGREYWLGIAELDGIYSEFKEIHAKCYCGRSVDDNELHITVAGVPKDGVKVLNDNIDNFRPGLVFPGNVTGKKTYTYFFNEDIHIDKNGNEIADSIDMSPCDYLLNSVYTYEDIKHKYVGVQVYD